MSHINNLDEKHEIVHIGAVDVPAAGVAAAELSAELETMEKYNSSVPAQEVLVSAFADMPAGQAKRKFWRLFFIGFAVAVSGTYLGYTLTIPGSIVGNQGVFETSELTEGFINQFGTVRDSAGVLSLDALYVSLWNGTNFASQVVFQIVSPFMADKLGLKLNMYIFTLLIVLVGSWTNALTPGRRTRDHCQGLESVPRRQGRQWFRRRLYRDNHHDLRV